MAISVPVPVKPHAALKDTGGVPLGDLPEMVGPEVLLRIGFAAIGDQFDQLDEAVQLTVLPFRVAVQDACEVRAVEDTTSRVIERWRLDPDDFTALTAAAEGDTLTTAGATPTGVQITSDGGSAMVFGRTSGDHVLAQRVGSWGPATDSDSLRLYAVAVQHNRGLLDRRISPLQDHANRVIVVKAFSTTEPDAPAAGEVTFDGTIVATGENSEWKPLETESTSTDPEWLASATFTYNFFQGRWFPRGQWAVAAGGSTFRVEYSPTGEAPWSGTVPTERPYFIRIRNSQGSWDVHQIGAPASRSWNRSWALGITLGASSPSTRTLFTVRLSWTNTMFVALSWKQDVNYGTGATAGVQSQRRVVLIPSTFVRTVESSRTGLRPQSIFVRFADAGSSYSIGDQLGSVADWMNAATADDQRVRIEFLGASDNSQDASSGTRLTIGFLGSDAEMEIWTI